MQIGRKIYYDLSTGNVLVDTGESEGFATETTIEQDIINYKALSERNRETFDYIDLEYGQYRQDFMECNGYQVNLETKELEFSYPEGETPSEPTYQVPLSQQVTDLESKLEMQEQAITELSIYIATLGI